jgi:aspartate aminotransferase
LQSQISKKDKEDENFAPAVSLVDMFLKAREMERSGKDIIHFDAGEPDFEPPPQVVDATISALKEGKARYTESAGVPAAKRAVSEKLNRRYGSVLAPENVLLTAGGRLALYYAFMSIPKDDMVGVATPDWPAYRDLCRFLTLKSRFFKTSLDSGWDLDLGEIENSRCKALILNYPNNPTGKVLDKKKFTQLMELAERKGMLVISDEVYSDYVFDGGKEFTSVLQFPNLNFMLVSSLSKSYAMTGFRAAYIVSDRKTISRLTNINSMVVTSMPEFVQYAMIAAMNCDDYVREKVQMIARRRDTATKALTKNLDAEYYTPDGSLYIFPRLHSQSSSPGAFDSEKFAVELLDKEYVSVTPGTSFGPLFREHIRMTLLQNDSRIEEGIERMSKIL